MKPEISSPRRSALLRGRVPAFVGERLARGRISLFLRRCATHIPGRVSYLCRNLTIFTISGAANDPAPAGQIALAHAWGGGKVASADGIRFVVPVACFIHNV
jgi:hypothetical protein